MYKIINSDVYCGLSSLSNDSIDLAITSPPYWNQRDYGFDGQIGNEGSYQEYIGKLISIFNLLRKKLNKEGVFFLNIGDKYLSKYGKSPLGFIPFKLARFMILDGWKLDDIIIWYKPNHMPSSVKNRFTNSYEPVFVFTKSEHNIFQRKRDNNPDYSNILKVSLQFTPYNHIAVYPENLVFNLLELVELHEENVILDPFAGSGTTLKVVQNLNESIFSDNLSAIMIENSSDYVEVMKKRCSLGDDCIIKLDFKAYKYEEINDDNFYNLHFKKDLSLNEKFAENGFLIILDRKKEYNNLLSLFLNGEIKKVFKKDGICFIGSKEFDLEMIYNTSLINDYGWIIRNMIVVENNKKWFPIFMIVDDNKIVRYKFNYKKMNLSHKIPPNKKRRKINFTGYKVVNNLNKNKIQGIIVEILETNSLGFPKYVIVKWEDKSYSKEFVIFSEENINENLVFIYNDDNLISNIKEKKSLININTKLEYYNNIEDKTVIKDEVGINKNYMGKFKNEKRKNWGASPGARASLEEDYFSKRRLYNVDQVLVADYLNLKRKKKNLTKKELTEIFPAKYKHTVGHWLRKDFGGSIPIKEDWKILDKVLDLDKFFSNYVCKTALKLQTVSNGKYKLPEDFVRTNFLEKLSYLIQDK